jgi:hypothetical protein
VDFPPSGRTRRSGRERFFRFGRPFSARRRCGFRAWDGICLRGFGILNGASVEGTEELLKGIKKTFDNFLFVVGGEAVHEDENKRRKSQQAVAQTVFLNEAAPF